MPEKAVVQIIGAPIACSGGVKDSWREVAAWAAGQLRGSFGDAVDVVYYDLFDPDCPPLAAGAQLPHVLVSGEVVTNGGKISIPAIRKRLLEIGVAPKSA
jgi:hypothetical protein